MRYKGKKSNHHVCMWTRRQTPSDACASSVVSGSAKAIEISTKSWKWSSTRGERLITRHVIFIIRSFLRFKDMSGVTDSLVSIDLILFSLRLALLLSPSRMFHGQVEIHFQLRLYVHSDIRTHARTWRKVASHFHGNVHARLHGRVRGRTCCFAMRVLSNVYE